ncbi:MAG: TonB-dependent receptor [Pseudomonadota bacterium]
MTAPRPRRLWHALLATFVLLALDASAQRAAENVVRSVDDAFGASVGEEQIGLYSPGSVRGFSPTSAGNVRIEGLFIDRQTGFSGRLVSGSTIRAGLTAQGYLLPAPTGIADFSLRRVAESPTQSAILRLNEYGGYGFAIDLQGRFADGVVETTGGVGFDRFEFGDGSTDKFATVGGTVRLQPRPRVDVTLLADYTALLQEQISPRYFPATADTPPRVPRREFVGQSWVGFEGDRYNVGLIAKLEPRLVDIELGLFRSGFDDDGQAGQFFTQVQPDATGQRLAFLGPARDAVSDSLEARFSKRLQGERRLHTFALSVRARQRERRFGGGVEIDLGEGRIDVANPLPEPDVTFSEVSREEVDQITGGLSYDLRWQGVGQLNLGVQFTDYKRVLNDPLDSPVTSNASPVLYNATGALELRPWLVAYGGVVTGFEESPTAPAISLNRNEAPPAIETRQADAGLRARVGSLTAVAGVFSIEKPFFGLNGERLFIERGTVTNRGVELSLAGLVTPELQMVVGTLLLDATLTGDAVDEGELSSNPIGVVRRVTTVDLDYRPRWASGWSFDVSVFSRGLENGDELDQLRIPERTLVNLGFRRQFTLRERTLVLRGRLSNLFDTFGWSVSGNGAFTFEGPRAFTLSLRADF